jgi:hypothetical protein
MMFADSDEVDAQLVCQRRLFNQIPDHDGVRKQRTIGIGSDVPKGVQSHIRMDGHLSAASFPDFEKPRRGGDSLGDAAIERTIACADRPVELLMLGDRLEVKASHARELLVPGSQALPRVQPLGQRESRSAQAAWSADRRASAGVVPGRDSLTLGRRPGRRPFSEWMTPQRLSAMRSVPVA